MMTATFTNFQHLLFGEINYRIGEAGNSTDMRHTKIM